MKKLIVSIGVCALLWGCTNLSQTGVYGSKGTAGTFLYNSDNLVSQSYNTIDAFLVLENQNHAYFKTNAPSVVTFANALRTNVPKYSADYAIASIALRNAIGTVTEASASNTVVVALSTITNLSATISTVISNNPIK